MNNNTLLNDLKRLERDIATRTIISSIEMRRRFKTIIKKAEEIETTNNKK